MVGRGYIIPFHSAPPSHPPTPCLFNPLSRASPSGGDPSAPRPRGCRVGSPGSTGQGLLFPIFPGPQSQRGKGFHPILDLRDLNAFIIKTKLKMVTLASIIPSLAPGDWYTALDLKDAFFHISIALHFMGFPQPPGSLRSALLL